MVTAITHWLELPFVIPKIKLPADAIPPHRAYGSGLAGGVSLIVIEPPSCVQFVGTNAPPVDGATAR